MPKLILVVLEIVVNFGPITILFSASVLFLLWGMVEVVYSSSKNTDLGLVTLIDGELNFSFSPSVLMCLLPIVSQRE